MKKLIEKCKASPVAVVLAGVIFIYFGCICILNLSQNPGFYAFDMYSDTWYAVNAWESKSIFPDGWVFGNQMYVVATPVLAALIYGVVGNPALAMAIATLIMAVGVIFSFLWMLKAAFPRVEERLVAVLGFIAITAYAGNCIRDLNGWQLFFTMCSYYACYAITAFLAFGLFLRRREKLTKSRIATLAIAILLSFGTGMQSLRQTLVMVPAMLALEGIAQLINLKKHKRLEKQPILITLALSVSNLLGVILIRLLNIPKHEIFEFTRFTAIGSLPLMVKRCIQTILSLIAGEAVYDILVLIVLAVVAGFAIRLLIKRENPHCGTLTALFLISIICVALIAVFTDMTVRNIYYFMLLPFISVMFSYAYRYFKPGKVIVLALLAVLVVASMKNSVLPEVKNALNAEADPAYQIADMLLEKGYTTVYSSWDQSEDFAIASGCKIRVGLFYGAEENFRPLLFLLNPEVYREDADKCVYYLTHTNRDSMFAYAKEKGVTMTLVAEYPERDIWLYQASENLMKVSE